MKKITKSILILFILIISATNISAQTKPTAEAAMSFLNFYFKGQGQGVVLADVKICTEIKDNECVDTVAADSLKNGSQYYLWMLYVVPKDDQVDDIIIHFNYGGLTRLTRDVSVRGSIRYRTWKSFTLDRTGKWEIKIMHDLGNKIETLWTLALTVIE